MNGIDVSSLTKGNDADGCPECVRYANGEERIRGGRRGWEEAGCAVVEGERFTFWAVMRKCKDASLICLQCSRSRYALRHVGKGKGSRKWSFQQLHLSGASRPLIPNADIDAAAAPEDGTTCSGGRRMW
jgi:hypothetical protein